MRALQPFTSSTRATTVVLLITSGVLLVGGGLLGTLLGVRASLEGFSTTATGLVMSAPVAGFILGAFLGVGIIARVGHVRACAAFAAVSTAIAVGFVLWIDVLP